MRRLLRGARILFEDPKVAHELAELAAGNEAVRRFERTCRERGDPTYDADALTVWEKDTGFLRDPRSVCYLSLDMNVVAPERAAIEFFWDKLVPGAPVILDDYGWLGYRPQKRALDEFAASRGVMILTLPTGQGLLLKS